MALALAASGCDQAHVRHRPRLLSDNGSSYISGDLAEWLDAKDMTYVRGAPDHPQTQGKIERQKEEGHQTITYLSRVERPGVNSPDRGQ